MGRVFSYLRAALTVVLVFVCVSAQATERLSLLIRNVGMDDLRVALDAYTAKTGFEVVSSS